MARVPHHIVMACHEWRPIPIGFVHSSHTRQGDSSLQRHLHGDLCEGIIRRHLTLRDVLEPVLLILHYAGAHGEPRARHGWRQHMCGLRMRHTRTMPPVMHVGVLYTLVTSGLAEEGLLAHLFACEAWMFWRHRLSR